MKVGNYKKEKEKKNNECDIHYVWSDNTKNTKRKDSAYHARHRDRRTKKRKRNRRERNRKRIHRTTQKSKNNTRRDPPKE